MRAPRSRYNSIHVKSISSMLYRSSKLARHKWFAIKEIVGINKYSTGGGTSVIVQVNTL
jgi:hypothetical protein